MKVIRKRPGQAPEIIDIDNTLEALQREVGGYIETVTVASDLCIICNEEGRLRGLPYNVRLGGLTFVGAILLVGVRGEEFADVPDPEGVLRMFGWTGRRHGHD